MRPRSYVCVRHRWSEDYLFSFETTVCVGGDTSLTPRSVSILLTVRQQVMFLGRNQKPDRTPIRRVAQHLNLSYIRPLPPVSDAVAKQPNIAIFLGSIFIELYIVKHPS